MRSQTRIAARTVGSMLIVASAFIATAQAQIYRIAARNCMPSAHYVTASGQQISAPRVGTAFAVQGSDGLFTALHVVLGQCESILALDNDHHTQGAGGQISSPSFTGLHITKVDIARDVAYLEGAIGGEPAGRFALPDCTSFASRRSGALVSSKGYGQASWYSTPQTPWRINHPNGYVPLHLLVPTLKTALNQRGSPEPTISVLNLSHMVEPGASGSPVWWEDADSKPIVGIVDGSADPGKSLVSWAIDWCDVRLRDVADARDELAALSARELLPYLNAMIAAPDDEPVTAEPVQISLVAEQSVVEQHSTESVVSPVVRHEVVNGAFANRFSIPLTQVQAQRVSPRRTFQIVQSPMRLALGTVNLPTTAASDAPVSIATPRESATASRVVLTIDGQEIMGSLGGLICSPSHRQAYRVTVQESFMNVRTFGEADAKRLCEGRPDPKRFATEVALLSPDGIARFDGAQKQRLTHSISSMALIVRDTAAEIPAATPIN